MDKELAVNIHAVSGAVVFIIGLLQIILKKGGKTHQILGKLYLVAWIVLLITGTYIGSPFITMLGVFGFYYALTGSRIGSFKNKPIQLFDKGIMILGAGVSVYMLYAAVRLYLNDNTSFAIIFAVFGLIFLNSTIQDILKYIYNKKCKKEDLGKMDWYFEHFIRMAISFIAAVTAFTSIQNVFNNNTVNFLAPTVIGTVLIVWAKRTYKKKFNLN
ncbi:MAG: hypothetical protein ACPG19_00150 [Saprospiraceae bacterium]